MSSTRERLTNLRYKVLVHLQRTKKPVVTIREVRDALDLSSTSHASYVLNKLVDEGLAERINIGPRMNNYHILDDEKEFDNDTKL